MNNRVLYFPYIKVPESTWFTQMLLYWDQVASIVPSDFIGNPESLGSYMQDLLKEELVFQIIPGQYIQQIPNFLECFTKYIREIEPELENRRNDFKAGKRFKIHIEKMGEIGRLLCDCDLAIDDDYPWYFVESKTANDFMTYLASSLGKLSELNSMPVTDSIRILRRIQPHTDEQAELEGKIGRIRLQILDSILPIPAETIAPATIRIFRDSHSDKLQNFRLRVEKEIIDIASINDSQLQKKRLDLFYEEAENNIIEIQDAMSNAGWRVARGTISVLSAIFGTTPLVGLVGAIWNALSPEQKQKDAGDFAYAAYAGKVLH